MDDMPRIAGGNREIHLDERLRLMNDKVRVEEKDRKFSVNGLRHNAARHNAALPKVIN